MARKIATPGYSNATASPGRRTVSGAFNQLNPAMVRELKESFTLLDKDGNGTVTEDDLEEMLVSVGQDPSGEQLKEMLELMPAPLTFSSYLTGMSNHLCQLSSKEELLSAFGAFSTEKGKSLDYENLKANLVEYGLVTDDIDDCLKPYVRSSGFTPDQFMYEEFVGMLRGD